METTIYRKTDPAALIALARDIDGIAPEIGQDGKEWHDQLVDLGFYGAMATVDAWSQVRSIEQVYPQLVGNALRMWRVFLPVVVRSASYKGLLPDEEATQEITQATKLGWFDRVEYWAPRYPHWTQYGTMAVGVKRIQGKEHFFQLVSWAERLKPLPKVPLWRLVPLWQRLVATMMIVWLRLRLMSQKTATMLLGAAFLLMVGFFVGTALALVNQVLLNEPPEETNTIVWEPSESSDSMTMEEYDMYRGGALYFDPETVPNEVESTPRGWTELSPETPVPPTTDPLSMSPTSDPEVPDPYYTPPPMPSQVVSTEVEPIP